MTSAFSVQPADFERDFDALRRIRVGVFCIEQDVPEALEWDGIDGDCIEHAVDLCDHVALRHHGRMHALLDAAVSAQRNAKQIANRVVIFGAIQPARGDAARIDSSRIGSGRCGSAGIGGPGMPVLTDTATPSSMHFE